MKPCLGDRLYRYEDAPLTTRLKNEIALRLYRVERVTPFGCTLREDWGGFSSATAKRIRTNCRRLFAHASKEEAAKAYYARKRRQVEILASRLSRAEDLMRQAAAACPPAKGEGG